MKNNNLIRFVQAMAILPAITMSLPLSSLQNISVSDNVLVQKVNIEADGTSANNQAIVSNADTANSKEEVLKAEAAAIDAYFADHDMPLLGMGMKMAQEADLNSLDWRLIPAIAVRESSGGKNACDNAKNNPFGWGSCKISFKSTEAAIETIAKNLGGNNPSTVKHYANKKVVEILHAYNPPSVIPKYAEQVMSIMNKIGNADMTASTATLASANS
jgi:hypothetical protein